MKTSTMNRVMERRGQDALRLITAFALVMLVTVNAQAQAIPDFPFTSYNGNADNRLNGLGGRDNPAWDCNNGSQDLADPGESASWGQNWRHARNNWPLNKDAGQAPGVKYILAQHQADGCYQAAKVSADKAAFRRGQSVANAALAGSGAPFTIAAPPVTAALAGLTGLSLNLANNMDARAIYWNQVKPVWEYIYSIATCYSDLPQDAKQGVAASRANYNLGADGSVTLNKNDDGTYKYWAPTRCNSDRSPIGR